MQRSSRRSVLRVQLGAALFWILMGVAAAWSGLNAAAEVGPFIAAIGHIGAAVWELRRRRRDPAPPHA